MMTTHTMEDRVMRECMRKLALWHTRTFKPIMTHDELDLIMATKGFVALPPSSAAGNASLLWKEYVHYPLNARSSPPPSQPRPRLPYPRIDGLHIYTYRAFLDAVNFYLEMTDISDLFHIRGMPLHRIHDRNKKWLLIEEDDHIFVYRDGTLDKTTEIFYKSDDQRFKEHDSMVVRDKSSKTPDSCCIVALKDVIILQSR